MTALRLILWPFALAVSTFRSLTAPAVHIALHAETACGKALSPGGHERTIIGVSYPYDKRRAWYTSEPHRVTCRVCRRVLVEAFLVTPEDFARRDGAS